MDVGQHNTDSELAVAAVLPYVVQEDTVPAPVLLLLWLALPLRTDRILELTRFLQDWSQREHQRACIKYILLFCWRWAIQLGKGHFNISLDLFSSIQIRKENAQKQKYDYFGGRQCTWRGGRGKGSMLVLNIPLWLLQLDLALWPLDCFAQLQRCQAASEPHHRRIPQAGEDPQVAQSLSPLYRRIKVLPAHLSNCQSY